MKKLLLIILILCGFVSNAQYLFHQDLFHGGVCTAGFLDWSAGEDEREVNLYIEPGSTIRKAYLFSAWVGDFRVDHHVFINDVRYNFQDEDLATDMLHEEPLFDRLRIYAKDITDSIDANVLSYVLRIPEIPPGTPFGAYGPKSVTLYIEYDNPSLPIVSTSILLTNQTIDGYLIFKPDNLNPVDTNYPMANATSISHASTFGDDDATQVKLVDGINFIEVGNIFGGGYDDTPWPIYNVNPSGDFYYQNNQLYGISACTPDAFVDSMDALYDMSSYLENGDTGYEQRFIYINLSHQSGFNMPLHIMHAYTSPCDTFSVGITSDTIICKGDSVQLQAWGNTQYNWLYGTNISDTTIANPYVSPDSSQLYTVLINDGNGCGKTANVFVQVLESPSITELAITETSCGLEEGVIEITQTENTQAGYQFSLNGGSLQESSVFDSLSYGNYYIQIQNPNGCVGDTSIFVPYNIVTVADFAADPTEGYAPLNVNFINHSQNANNYFWDFGNTNTSTEEHPSTNYPQTGSYEIELIAYLNDTICADTTSLIIHVYNPIQAIIPNVITPNGDGFNEVFSVQIEGAVKLTASFRNRWGNELEKVSKDLSGAQETVVLWSPTGITPGTYFYDIEAEDALGEKQFFQGFVVVKL